MVPTSPNRWFMELNLDWNLKYKTHEDLLAMGRAAAPDATVAIREEPSGVNPFVVLTGREPGRAGTADEVEPRWRAWLVERNRRGTRLVLWIGITMYPLFGVLDWLVAPAAWLKVLWCTRAFVTVLTLAMFRLLPTRWFERFPNSLSASYLIVGSCGISLMTVVLEGLASPYYAGLSLIIVATGLLFVWPPQVVLITHAIIVLSFLLRPT